MGLKRAGKRRMMKLPKERRGRAELTATVCPKCGRTGVMEYETRGSLTRACTWCSHQWPANGGL